MAKPKTADERILMEAIKKGNTARVKELLNNNFTNLNDERYFDYELIIEALKKNRTVLAKLLINKGFRVYKKYPVEKTILEYAVYLKDIDIIKSLLAKGASPDILVSNKQHKTPFHLAIEKNQLPIIELFLSQFDVQTFDDKNLVHYAVEQDKVQVITRLIEKGFSLKIMNEYKCLNACCELTLLHCAVQNIKLEVVEFLLSNGADICVQNKDESSALHMAFENKEKGIWDTWQDFEDNNSIIDLILKANMELKSNPVNKNGLSHFHVACSRDEPSIVEHFLKFGASINQPVNSQCHLYKGFAPLHFAAKFRCRKTLKLLLKNGADVEQRDYEEMTALHIAAKETCLDGVRLLLEYGADIASIDCHGNSPIHWAFLKQNYAIVDLLSVHNTAHSNPVNTKGISHFHIACTRDNIDLVKSFIENGVSIDTCTFAEAEDKKYLTVDTSGFSPLHFAVSHNRANIVELLLHSGANVGIKNVEGFTPLNVTCQYISTEMFREFIQTVLCEFNKCGNIVCSELKPITDITTVSENYSGGLDGSIEKIDWSLNRIDHLKIVNLLLKYKSDVNCKCNHGYTPVFHAYACTVYVRTLKNDLDCSKPLWKEIIQSLSKEVQDRRKLILNNLLKQKVDFDNCCKAGSILYQLSCINGFDDYETVELLVKAGANVNVTNHEKLTPLYTAVERENNLAVSVLLDYGADVDCLNPEDNSTPLLVAAKYLYFDIMKMLIDRGANVNARQSDGSTALHNVVNSYISRTHAEHFNYKFDPYDSDSEHYDDDNKHIDPPPIEVISTLIKAGANVNSRDSNGFTPLHKACELNIPVEIMVKKFLAFGADINVVDNRGRSVCCYLYQRTYDCYIFHRLLESCTILINHIVKMRVIGLPVSPKALSSYDKLKESSFVKSTLEKEKQFIGELQSLQETKINDNCMLYDAIFKNENALSHLVKNPAFESVVQSKSFEKTYPNYGYLIQLKYQAGLDRVELLPIANDVLSNLAGLYLPDACSEHICSYFTNSELKECIHVLSSLLNLKKKKLR